MSGTLVLAECQDVSRVFGSGPTAVVAVHGSSCTVADGARIAVVGASGSGKSTLLHLLAGLEHPTTGTARWPALAAAGSDRAGQIGVVFQGPSLVPSLSVAENTALPLLLSGVDDAEARAADALRSLDINDLADKLPDEISGGQAQRVAVARVLARRPRLVLADEPTGQLDRASGQHLIEVLLTATAQIGAALLISTHDQSVADRLDTHWFMHAGRLHTSTSETVRS